MDKDSEARLHAYLEDHLTGALKATALLRDARGRWDGGTDAFFEALLSEIEADRGALEDVLARVGAEPSRLKNAAAAAAEKALALRHRLIDERLALVEMLEALLLGVRGKRALWVVLEDLARTNGRLSDVDFGALGRRAEDQLERIEQRRRAAARAAFADA
ncbi:MAG TPA: hypothetical protein VK002_02290 [Rubricoccaceae bacterium]|nr:hypothetical protein [Rubricoccaceae bacterium]